MSTLFENLNHGINELHPYEPGRSIEEVVAEYKPERVVKLASNENPLGPSPRALEAIQNFSSDLHLYPDGDASKLKDLLAEMEGVDSDQLIIGNGSNEILELAARAFLNKDTSAVMSKHAFAVYKIVTQACGSEIVEVPMREWTHDLEKFSDYIKSNTRICFIANPNNPTGTYNSHNDFVNMMNEIPSSILVILDLAYFEYVDKNDYVNTQSLLNQFPNLLVTKTFSKIQGLASLRIGYGLGSKKIMKIFNKIRQPFNTNSLAQEAAFHAINDKEHIQKSIDLNNTERKRVSLELESMGFNCIPSQGNFIAFKGNFNPIEIFTELMKQGVIVRPIALYDMPEYLRVTIGTESENNYFLEKVRLLANE